MWLNKQGLDWPSLKFDYSRHIGTNTSKWNIFELQVKYEENRRMMSITQLISTDKEKKQVKIFLK